MTGRNEPCPCGSQRKYKVCCGAHSTTQIRTAEVQSSPAPFRIAQTPEAIFERGLALLNAGRPAEALSAFDATLQSKPDFAVAHERRGFALEQLGWYAEAAVSHRRAITLAPRMTSAHVRLGSALLVQDMREAASAAFRKAASIEPKTLLGRLSLAYALIAENKPAEAEIILRRAIALFPSNAAAHAKLGEILAEAGNADQAWSAFAKAISLDPKAPGRYYDLVRIRKLTDADRPVLDAMLAAEKRTDIHDLHRIMLELAIAKAYDDFGQYEAAMQHVDAANKLKAKIRPLDRRTLTALIEWQIRTFTPQLFAQFDGSRSSSSMPILIIGMPRSGTTLVETILANHSEVAAGQELPFWNRKGREAMASGSSLAHFTRDWADQYLTILREIADAPHVTDKKPDNFLWAGLIHLVFPNARIVHCTRDPVDTCLSILKNFFAPRPDFSTDPADLVFYYEQYQRIIAHWRQTLPPGCFIDVAYEDLIQKPEDEICRLLAFLGLPWEDSCLHPEMATRSINTASLWQARQPIFTSSIGRWKLYEPWLGEIKKLTRGSP